jgi:hypothetical protein
LPSFWTRPCSRFTGLVDPPFSVTGAPVAQSRILQQVQQEHAIDNTIHLAQQFDAFRDERSILNQMPTSCSIIQSQDGAGVSRPILRINLWEAFPCVVFLESLAFVFVVGKSKSVSTSHMILLKIRNCGMPTNRSSERATGTLLPPHRTVIDSKYDPLSRCVLVSPSQR